MSVDQLQNKIRKMKNPSMVEFSLDFSMIPPSFAEAQNDPFAAYSQYAKCLLDGLAEIVPGIRFSFSCFALQGTAGLELLTQLLDTAKAKGYYVLLDVPTACSSQNAALSAEALLNNWKFDGLVLNSYIGSDGIKPFLKLLKNTDKDLFVALRTANKSAAEIQDLLTGTRLLYTVTGDMTKYLGEEFITRNGYSRICGIGPATSAETLQTLRSKYPSMFLLIDGFDYSGANAKNCSAAFDQLGHGAIACAGESVFAAWREESGDPVMLAVQAAERMKKNLTRYIAIL